MPKPFLIMNAGIRRSGSVWQFNVIRLALKQSGYNVYGSFHVQYKPTNEAPIHLVKSHKFLPKLAEKAKLTYTSFRDIWEIKHSIKRRAEQSEPPIPLSKTKWPKISGEIAHLLKWQQQADYITWFEKIKTEPLEEIRRIIAPLRHHFDITTTPASIRLKLDSLKPPLEGFDPETLMVTNHITS